MDFKQTDHFIYQYDNLRISTAKNNLNSWSYYNEDAGFMLVIPVWSLLPFHEH